jgi:hypothetical protein
MSDPASDDPLITASTYDKVLQALRPHLRKVVEAADPTLLGAFDAAYVDGTTDAVEELINGPSNLDELSGEQALGFRGIAAATLLPFMINVAASIAVTRVQVNYPAAWAWIAGLPPSAEIPNQADTVDRLMCKSRLKEDERAKAVEQFRSDQVLMRLLELTYPP